MSGAWQLRLVSAGSAEAMGSCAERLATLLPGLTVETRTATDDQAALGDLGRGAADLVLPAAAGELPQSAGCDWFACDWSFASGQETGLPAEIVWFRADDPRAQAWRSLFVKAITFVGAGPGNPASCTIGGVDALRHCDVCLYDALASPALLDYLPADAEAIFVGKRGGRYTLARSLLDARLAELCRRGRRVVRLKGGDPGIFGRLAQELAPLIAAGLPFRVLPGVSSLTAATTGTGLLLTRRGLNRGFAAATPQLATGSGGLPTQAERQAMPICLFMAVVPAAEMAAQLIREGRSATEPAAMVFAAGLDDEKVVIGTLATIGDLVREHDTGAPGLLVIGEVAAPTHRYQPRGGAFSGHRVLLCCRREELDLATHLVHDRGGRPMAFAAAGPRAAARTPLPSAWELAIVSDAAAAGRLLENLGAVPSGARIVVGGDDVAAMLRARGLAVTLLAADEISGLLARAAAWTISEAAAGPDRGPG